MKDVRLLLLVLLAFGSAGADLEPVRPEVSRIRVRRSAVIESRTVRLRDVAVLKGIGAAKLGTVEVGQIASERENIKISLVSLRERLDKHGVNWGRLSLGGFSHCRVRYSEPDVQVDQANYDATEVNVGTGPVDAGELVLVNPTGPVSIDSAMSVRDLLLRFLREMSGIEVDQMGVEFAARDIMGLSRLVGRDRLEFVPGGAVGVGRLPITIHRYRGGELKETQQVTADITWRQLCVVAKRTITRGQSLVPGDVEIREVVIDRSGMDPLTDLRLVIGQAAARFIRQGTVMESDDVRPPVMVRRGELITVQCMTDGLLIKTVGRASEEGVLGDLIAVRNEQSREQYMVRITGPRVGVTGGVVEQTEGSHSSVVVTGSLDNGRQDR